MVDVPGRRYDFGEQVFSDWFARGGDGMILRAEAIDADVTNNMTLYVEVYTKNVEEGGEGAPADTGSPTSWRLELDPTVTTVQQLVKTSASSTDGLEEMVRLKITTHGGAKGDWILARIFPPIFFDLAN